MHVWGDQRMQDEPYDRQRRGLLMAFKASRLTLDEVWSRYREGGGHVGAVEIGAYISGLMPISDREHNILAGVINDRLDEMPPPVHAPYRRPASSSPSPPSGKVIPPRR
jgi:hypothetical protein